MDEEFNLFHYQRSLKKAERNRAQVEDRYYEENDGTEFRAFMCWLTWPATLVRTILKKQKKSGAYSAAGQVREHCFD